MVIKCYFTFVPDLLFVDEAQKISDNARGVILENVLLMKSLIETNQLRLFLLVRCLLIQKNY